MGVPSRNVEDRRSQVQEITPERYAWWTNRRVPLMSPEQARANATLGAMMGAFAGQSKSIDKPIELNESMGDITSRMDANAARQKVLRDAWRAAGHPEGALERYQSKYGWSPSFDIPKGEALPPKQ